MTYIRLLGEYKAKREEENFKSGQVSREKIQLRELYFERKIQQSRAVLLSYDSLRDVYIDLIRHDTTDTALCKTVAIS